MEVQISTCRFRVHDEECRSQLRIKDEEKYTWLKVVGGKKSQEKVPMQIRDLTPKHLFIFIFLFL